MDLVTITGFSPAAAYAACWEIGLCFWGGSGEKQIISERLRKIAPYAERISFTFYILQNMTFGISCAIMYDFIVWSGILAAFIGILGSLSGIIIKSRFMGFLPYQLAGFLWLVASSIGIVAGFDVQNPGVIVTSSMLLLGAACVMVSHRAEFRKAEA